MRIQNKHVPDKTASSVASWDGIDSADNAQTGPLSWGLDSVRVRLQLP